MRGGTASSRKRSSSHWMRYEVPGHAVGDSSPAAAQTACRNANSYRKGFACPRGGSVSTSSEGRHPSHRGDESKEVSYPDWRLPRDLRGRWARSEGRRDLHSWTGLSVTSGAAGLEFCASTSASTSRARGSWVGAARTPLRTGRPYSIAQGGRFPRSGPSFDEAIHPVRSRGFDHFLENGERAAFDARELEDVHRGALGLRGRKGKHV